MAKTTRKANTKLGETIDYLARQKEKRAYCRRIAKYLSRPSRQMASVNLKKIEKMACENESIAVPGKVLGTGELTKSVNIYALSFSESALRKINDSKGKAMPIKDVAACKKAARIII